MGPHARRCQQQGDTKPVLGTRAGAGRHGRRAPHTEASASAEMGREKKQTPGERLTEITFKSGGEEKTGVEGEANQWLRH